MTSADLLALYQPLLNGTLGYFRKVSDDTPHLDDALWSGTFDTPDGPKEETAQSLRQVMAHCVIGTYEVPRAMVDGTFERVPAAAAALAGLAPSDLTAKLEAATAEVLALIGGLDEAALAESRTTPLGTTSVGVALCLAATHLAHHKGQMTVLLRRAGLRPGRMF